MMTCVNKTGNYFKDAIILPMSLFLFFSSFFTNIAFSEVDTNLDSELVQTIQYYDQRDSSDEGMEVAREASIRFEEYSHKTERTAYQRAYSCLMGSKAYFFLGDFSKDNEAKRTYFTKGFEIAEKGMTFIQISLGKAAEAEYSELLASLYYNYSANLGRWGEINGILNSLQKWPIIKKYLNAILDMKQEEVEAYGVYRYLGRAYYEIPYPIGDKRKSMRYLEKAFRKTLLREYRVSAFALTNVYYAEALWAQGQKEKAKTILKLLIRIEDQGQVDQYVEAYQKVHSEYRKAETLKEINTAREVLKKMQD